MCSWEDIRDKPRPSLQGNISEHLDQIKAKLLIKVHLKALKTSVLNQLFTMSDEVQHGNIFLPQQLYWFCWFEMGVTQ